VEGLWLLLLPLLFANAEIEKEEVMSAVYLIWAMLRMSVIRACGIDAVYAIAQIGKPSSERVSSAWGLL
jgi:hypothetical protein